VVFELELVLKLLGDLSCNACNWSCICFCICRIVPSEGGAMFRDFFWFTV